MSLDNLLGLLFLLFFVILPALSGLGKRPGVPELERPTTPKPEPPRPKPLKTPRARPHPSPSEKPKEASEKRPPQAPSLAALAKASEEGEAPKPKTKRPRLVQTKGNEILKGVIWHEILKKPRGW